ncbi:MAG: DUF3795 domain-containing protein [Deltaproteobacteria bacterium]|nr:DUF3795 domain-containing protein [Candidatus Zymogenaceae bacterium]
MKISENINLEKPITYIACCGFYCRTCKVYTDGQCRGCKLGYDTGERDIVRAKCKIKLCCFRDNKFEICADCADFPTCGLIRGRFTDYKLRRSLEFLDFIRSEGYPAFIEKADTWKDCLGKLD